MRYLPFLLFILSAYPGFSRAGNKAGPGLYARSIPLNSLSWKIAKDSANTGIRENWFKVPPLSGSQPTKIPWVIQDIFHNYHGVAWYWVEFETPENIPSEAISIIKFHAVDYLAEVWLNGHALGKHEGSEFAFEFDITKMLKDKAKNLLVVRVLNPTYQPIDGISLKETPSSLKNYPFSSNSVYNSGGITGDVELILAPPIRIQSIHAVPDWKTGKVKMHLSIKNDSPLPVSALFTIKVTNERHGKPYPLGQFKGNLDSGDNDLTLEVKVDHHRLWSPEDPVLYRIQTSLNAGNSGDEQAIRTGFRDFRYEDGYFRLNGKRIFLKGCNFSTHYPAGYTVPLTEDMLRRDVINLKSLGFNFVRIPFGCANPRVIDLYDELGILVHQEHYGSWQMGQFGKYPPPNVPGWEKRMSDRYENSVRRLILRDRNHPSIVMWGCLNEMFDGIIFRKAVDILPELRKLDATRIFVLNSGRFDRAKEIGSLSNPGSNQWDITETELKDWHPYVWIPYSPDILSELSGKRHRTGQKVFISEAGLCGPVDLPSELGDFQRWGKQHSDDAQYFKRQYTKFMTDWEKFNFSQIWSGTEDYIDEAYRTTASVRETAEAAIRSNPYLIAYAPTNGVADYSMGESVATNFRRLKPQMIKPVLLSNSDLRWCLITEPQSIYAGEKIRISLSLSNLDVLGPGTYPALIRILDSKKNAVFSERLLVTVPDTNTKSLPPFAWEVWNKEVVISDHPGQYQVVVRMEAGAAVDGGKTDFFVSKRDPVPPVSGEIVTLGEDAGLNEWLKKNKIPTVPFDTGNTGRRQVILVSGKQTPDSLTMLNIAAQMYMGSTVIFLSPAVLKKGPSLTGWMPLVSKGTLAPMDEVEGYYRADRWARPHPYFEGLSSGGMLDYKYFRNLISRNAICQEYTGSGVPAHIAVELSEPLSYPAEAVCGAVRVSHVYASGIHLGVWNFGNGKFLVNTLHITENLGIDPAADKLLCNILRVTSENLGRMKPLPPDFDETLKQIGYK